MKHTGRVLILFSGCLALLCTGWRTSAWSGPPLHLWDFPVDHYVPGSYASRDLSANHLGEDVRYPASSGADPEYAGTAVRAIAPGIIKLYRAASGYGELAVVIEHDLGVRTQLPNARGQ